MKKEQPSIHHTGEEKLRRLYYLAGRFVTAQISAQELAEISSLTKDEAEEEEEEYSQTFVILTSTGYLAHFFKGMGIEVALSDLYR
jgi:hypothetical protein